MSATILYVQKSKTLPRFLFIRLIKATNNLETYKNLTDRLNVNYKTANVWERNTHSLRLAIKILLGTRMLAAFNRS